MSEIEFVVPVNKPLKIVEDAVFNMHDLYKHIRSWLDSHSYITFEKQYNDWMKESGRSADIKLATWRKVDDYTKYNIDIKIKFKNLKEVETKSGILNKGEVSIKIESYIEKDYEGRWDKNFMSKFMRALYDHFFIREKIDGYKKELLDDSYDFYNEVKAFLGLHRLKKP